MNSQWNKGQKALAAIHFDNQLTLIVSRILVLDNLHQSRDLSGSNSEGIEIERLRQVKQLLVHLRISLVNILNIVDAASSETTKYSSLGEDDIHVKLVNQLNGISLPLLNNLQPKEDFSITNNNDFVRISALYANMEEAALALTVLWRCTRKVSESNDCIQYLALPILVSCAMALPALEVSRQDDGDAENGEEKKSNLLDGALDCGEDCATAILKLIQAVFIDPSQEHRSDACQLETQDQDMPFSEALSKEVGNAIGGSLVARIVLSNLSLLTQGSINSNNNNAIIHKPKEKSATLQLESLTTLRTIIERIPMPDLWKSMLPGCFAVRE
jgi:hypothetical protein